MKASTFPLLLTLNCKQHETVLELMIQAHIQGKTVTPEKGKA